jgi:hypothetical protein
MVTALLIIWGGYRFSVESYGHQAKLQKEEIDQFVGAKGAFHRLGYVVAEHAPIPAPELIEGIKAVRSHNAGGHSSYLLGEVRKTGWWHFFLITLAVKPPLPFLILSGLGIVMLGRWRDADWRALAPAAMALTVVTICMSTRIDIGVRHILPIYPLLAIVAGFGASRLWNSTQPKRVGPAVVVILVLWQLFASARIHPDYLAYFNELVGRHPDRVLVVGDLDWGQDLLRLANELHARKIDSVWLAYHGTAEPGRHNLPPWKNLQPCVRVTGWIAISEIALKIGVGDPPYRAWAWLDAYEPMAMVGKSIRLYYVP